MGLQGDHPQLGTQLGQQVPLVEGLGPAAGVQPGLFGELLVFRLAAQPVEFLGVHPAGEGAVPGVGPPAGEDGGGPVGEEGLQHGPGAVEQGFEGAGGVGPVLLRPEQVDQFTLGDAAGAVEDQVAQHAPQLQGPVFVLGQGALTHGQAQAAQHGRLEHGVPSAHVRIIHGGTPRFAPGRARTE